MKTIRNTIGISILLLLAMAAVSQTPSSSDGSGVVIKLRVRVPQGDKAKGLERKRFFLIKGSLEENKSLIDNLDRQPLLSRDCYYRINGASEAFIAWLRENDCESVYCGEVDQKSIDGPTAVPEFQLAVAAGEKEFGSSELARKWITVNLPKEFRSGFYELKQQTLQAFVKQAESVSHAQVMSVMTDRNGFAYFTDVEPGTYVISSILPIEIGSSSSLWKCSITVKPGDLPEKQFLITTPGNKDRRDQKPSCVSVPKPLPVCDSTKKQ